jgi:hypothetical protein
LSRSTFKIEVSALLMCHSDTLDFSIRPYTLHNYLASCLSPSPLSSVKTGACLCELKPEQKNTKY